MSKHVGIVACSAEGAALCYQTLCAEAQAKMGEHMHPEVSMHTHPLGKYMVPIRSGNWKEVAGLMLSSVRKLNDAGADFAICPDNTIHQAFDLVREESPIPWLHIAEAVADEAKNRGFGNLAILGTTYLMTGPVYPEVLDKSGITTHIPDEDGREKIDNIIFKELVNGVFQEKSRLYLTLDYLEDELCSKLTIVDAKTPKIPGGARGLWKRIKILNGANMQSLDATWRR